MATVAEIKRLHKEYERREANKKAVDITFDGFSFELKGRNKLIYEPTKTGLEFHQSNDFVKAVIGPVRSGKTTLSIADLIISAKNMPKCHDGIRRFSFAAIRNTYGELETTTLRSWNIWFGELGTAHTRMKAPLLYTSRFNDGDGFIDIEGWFIALNRPEDIKKLASLELTRAYVNEARFIPEVIIDMLQDRVGQYPKKDSVVGGEFPSGMILDTNPPSTDHWFYKKFEEKKTEGYTRFKQPPGLIKNEDGEYKTNPDADNIQNLNPSNYYERAAIGRTKESINVMLMGNYGIDMAGTPVYQEYHDDFHSVDNLDYISGVPIEVGMDFGRTPAVVFMQMSPSGKLLLIHEICSKDTGLRGFMDNHVTPYISKNLQGYKLTFHVDPSGASKSQNDETSCCDILRNEYRLDVRPGYSNSLSPRIEPVKKALTTFIDAKTGFGFSLSRTGAPICRKGFSGGYHFKKETKTDSSGALTERILDPEKNDYSHPHDAIQYVCMNVLGKPLARNEFKMNLGEVGEWN